MNDDEYKVAEHLPSSIDAEPITSLAQVTDVELGKINTDLVLIYPAIDSLNEQLIDYLAVQMHVDEYDDTETLDVKRQQVKQSFLLHRLKGTKYAVQKVVSTVYQSAKVEEWPEYSGEPYHFRVTGITAPMNETKAINKLVRLINAYKNTRSWLDYVQFNRLYRQTFLFGGDVNIVRKTTVTFDLKQKIITQKDIYFAGAVGTFRRDVIHGKLE